MMYQKVRIKRAFAAVIVLTGLAVMTSCESYVWSPPEIPQDVEISFSEHIYPVCQDCHSSWSLEQTYNKLYAKIDLENPANSPILDMHGTIFETRMVQVNDTLTIKASDAIILWVEQGAQNNK